MNLRQVATAQEAIDLVSNPSQSMIDYAAVFDPTASQIRIYGSSRLNAGRIASFANWPVTVEQGIVCVLANSRDIIDVAEQISHASGTRILVI